jgi:hypothetical protein
MAISSQLFPAKVPFKRLVKAVLRIGKRSSRHHRDGVSPSHLLPPPVLDVVSEAATSTVVTLGNIENVEGQREESSVEVSTPSSESPLGSSVQSRERMSESSTTGGGFEASSREGLSTSVYGETDAALGSEPMFTSPPTVYVEPEVPDPFLIDSDDEDSGEENAPTPTESRQEISLAPMPPSPSLQSPNRNKAVPPPPTSDSDEEEAPELYLPGLCIPTMFLPIPNVRVFSPPLLTWWLRPVLYTSRRRIH